MHVWKGLPQHRDTADAMTYWLETVTAVGVRLEADDSLTVIAPLGTDDLLGPLLPPTSFGRTRARRIRGAHRHQALARAVAEGAVRWISDAVAVTRPS